MSREKTTAEVRLVRCPKCGRLLPEISDYPVYQCGGCQTTLQAKNRGAPKSASKISETQAEATHLPAGKTEEKGTDGRVEELSCVEAEGRRQHVDGLTHEYQSYQDKKQNWACESSSSDDNGGGCCERVSEYQGENEEINLAQFDNSRKIPLNPTTFGPHPTDKYRQTQLTKIPLYHPHSESRQIREKAEEISDGSSDKLYPPRRNRLVNSAGSSSSDEVLNSSPRPHQGTGYTHLKTPNNTVSNLMPPDSLSKDLDRLEVADGEFAKPAFSGHHSPLISHEEANGAETRFRKGFRGQAPSNARVLHRPVDDSSNEWDYSVQIDGEVDYPIDHMIPNPFDLQSAPKNMNAGLLTDQSKSTQLEQQLQRRGMDNWQKHNHHKLHSQVREKSLESSAGPNKMDYKQIPDGLQPSHHVQQSQDVRDRWPHLPGYKPLESNRPDFYLNPKGSSQFNENYDYGEFDYNGNLPQVHETEYQILQKRMELLTKLDELRDQLSRSCQVPYSTVQSQHNIGRMVMTPGSRPIAVERELFQNGRCGGFFPTANDVESFTWGDYSDRSRQSSGQLVYGPKMQSIPRGEQHRMHIENESLYGMMDEEDISNGFASKHINPRDFGHRVSHGLYVEKRNATSHRIPQPSYSGEQGLNPQHWNNPFSHHSVNEEQTSCGCCSRHSLQHPGGCCSHAYQDRNACHMPLHVSPTVFCHQQLHTAANHMHFNNSYPTRVQARDTPAHKHPCSYHEVSEIQRSKSQESEQILYQEKKYAQGPVARKQRTLPCLPFAGGAPFVLCDNCLQLLLIPRNLSPKMKKKYKLRCGTCFSIFVFTVWSKRHGIAMAKNIDYPSRHMQGSHSKVQDTGISAANHATSSSSAIQNMLTNERDIHDTPHSHVDDYDIYISKSQSAHGKQDSLQLAPTVQNSLLKSRSISSKPHLPMVRLDEKLKGFSAQDCDSSPKHLHDTRSYQARDNYAMAEASSAPDIASPLAGSPLHEHFGYSSPLEMINRFHLEKTTITSQQKSVDLGKSSHSDNTFGWKHTKMATKPDVAEMENQEELSKESSWSWNTSIKGFFKKSFKDLKKANQGLEVVRSNVFVNGRPISDNLVKKAEEHAGPIQPGHYWYDYQAGFWGVMGEPCLGIIPPFIDEFNYPMPRDCAGGKTRILVNGRELHQKDLDRLASRGLPITKDKSYRIEISGRVVDKATNTELKSLGKLAPTLEKEGHGVGMRAPRKRL